MERGLDELIDGLLNEIAFSGWRGCTVTNLLAAIDSFYQQSAEERFANGDGPEPPGEPSYAATRQGLDVASKVWSWLVRRPDVSVGTNRQFNDLPLEDILRLPEDTDSESPAPTQESTTRKQTASRKPREEPNQEQSQSQDGGRSVRPRLHVSEERQWRMIAGHGPDSKRLPLFEWRALVDIASVKGNGILQGDLVRLTGQDKRSLPTRTDSLARKGYIIKRPFLLRGCRSSKLWLAQFAEEAERDDEGEGLQLDKVDLSKEALSRDLEPVSFCYKWNRDRLDYVAIAQTFIALTRAWGLIRYCDVRTKLGVDGKTRQMRALGKTSRWLTNIGAVSFVAARFAGNYRLFKDCVKYHRDPTPFEWEDFRTTPKANLRVPSARLGKRGEASRAKHKALESAGSKLLFKPPKPSTASAPGRPTGFPIIPNFWNPHKPMSNLVYEIVNRAGPGGSVNSRIGDLTLGGYYRRYISALMAGLSQSNSQPSHLQHYEITSQLNRVGKTMTYQFFTGEQAVTSLPGPATPREVGPSAAQNGNKEKTLVTTKEHSVFSEPPVSELAPNASLSLSELVRHLPKKTGKPSLGTGRTGRPPKRKASDEIIHTTHSKRRRRHLNQDVPSLQAAETDPEGRDYTGARDEIAESEEPSGIMNQSGTATAQPKPPPAPKSSPRAPGVYIGEKNSLDPLPRRGRPRRSLVLIFRSDKLKDPSFLNNTPGSAGADPSTGTSQARQSVTSPVAPTSTAKEEEESNVTEQGSQPSRWSTAPQRPKFVPVNGKYRCDKCGNTWKNDNGLEYHLFKSKTTCNSNYIPETTTPGGLKRPSRPHLQRSARPQLPENPRLSSLPPMRSALMTSNVPRDETPFAARYAPRAGELASNATPAPSASAHGSIILQDLEVFNVGDSRRRERQSAPKRTPKKAGNSSTETPQAPSTKPIESQKPSQQHVAPKQTTPAIAGPGDTHVQTGAASTSNSPLAVEGEHPRTTQSTTAEPKPSTMHDPTSASFISSQFVPINMPEPEEPQGQTPAPRRPLPDAKGPKAAGQRRALPSGRPPKADTQPSTPIPGQRPLSAFARPPRRNGATAALRRDRVAQIIQYALDQNEGVFPGGRSLYLAVISVWGREFSDLSPPDRRTCQNMVGVLDRAGVLKQLHFFFFDSQQHMQECTVVTETRLGQECELSVHPKVNAVKEKMREVFPKTYVPAAFALDEAEAELFEEVQARHRGKLYSSKHVNAPKHLKAPDVAREIEVLHYPKHVVADALALSKNAKSHKRPAAESAVGWDPKTSKKARLDVQGNPMQKPCIGRGKGEYWDSVKLAKFIWGQRKNQAFWWDQTPASLQDFGTGTWSWAPEVLVGRIPNITAILAAVQRDKVVEDSLKASRIAKRKRRSSSFSSSDDSYDESSIDRRAAIRRKLADPFIEPVTIASFVLEYVSSEDDDDDEFDDDEDTRTYDFEPIGEEKDPSSDPSNPTDSQFAQLSLLPETGKSCWPYLPRSFFESYATYSFSMNGSFPTARWFVKANMPLSLEDVLRSVKTSSTFKTWIDPAYGLFLRDVKAIRKWEESSEGMQVLMHGSTVPEWFFISVGSDAKRSKMKPVELEWVPTGQYTQENITDEIKTSTREEENFAYPAPIDEVEQFRQTKKRPGPKPKHPNGPQARKNAENRRRRTAAARSLEAEDKPQYKTRTLTAIPRQPRGRFNKPQMHAERLGVNRETQILCAFVVVKTLLGGVNRICDWGFILKQFPELSLSAAKKFWAKAFRERKSYIDVLTAKFQTSFIEAYKRGEIQPLDYDNLDDYDWRSLIEWTSKLETHENVDLPASRRMLDDSHTLKDPVDEVIDWREIWFSTNAPWTSTWNRIEAVGGDSITFALPRKQKDQVIASRARSWVRSLCCTKLGDAESRKEISNKFLQLTNGDTAAINDILGGVVGRLKAEKLIAQSKGKLSGQNFRLHANFEKQLDKLSSIGKFVQATAFKARLDDAFRAEGEYILPFASDDGSIMATLNLQTCGRIRIEPMDIPNIPFGFEPGNYEGRHFPKSYYHFGMKLLPTETYMYDEDMPLIEQAKAMEVPTRGPQDELPIWVDFFGKLDTGRWVDYLCMVVYALATKGPLAPGAAAMLLKPVVDEFEVRLIMDWLDRLGLLQRMDGGDGGAIKEWWWLVAGKCVHGKKQMKLFPRKFDFRT
ncbi:hypothetical protein F4780DRAFT_607602 [Xylariomycetidae sp. FL0641]|nr:hypothetical protein F4780DRAFT_607602 [Xylariomycetidae sp. FL0641]